MDVNLWFSYLENVYISCDYDSFYKNTNLNENYITKRDLFNIAVAFYNNYDIKHITKIFNAILKQKEIIENKLINLKKIISDNRILIIFCRHGYSTANYVNDKHNSIENYVIDTHEIDATLTTSGLEHSLSLYQKYIDKEINPDYIFTSILVRTQITAICQFRKKIYVVPFLKEINSVHDYLNKYSENLPLISPEEQQIRRLQSINFLKPEIDYKFINKYEDYHLLSGNINYFLLFLIDYIINFDKNLTIVVVCHHDVIKEFALQFGINLNNIKNNSAFYFNKKNELGMSVTDLFNLIESLFYNKDLFNYTLEKVDEIFDFIKK